MKALEILRTYKCPDEHGYVTPVMVTESYLLEAIAELEEIEKQTELVHTQLSYMTLYAVQKAKQVEELEEHKTCEGCKWENYEFHEHPCSSCAFAFRIYYEPKDK